MANLLVSLLEIGSMTRRSRDVEAGEYDRFVVLTFDGPWGQKDNFTSVRRTLSLSYAPVQELGRVSPGPRLMALAAVITTARRGYL